MIKVKSRQTPSSYVTFIMYMFGVSGQTKTIKLHPGGKGPNQQGFKGITGTESLPPGSLQSRATDFRSAHPLTRESTIWESTVWESTVSGHRF